ncbi:hypothetical protein [Enterococcus faecium]|uniref:hypothetical protein n=1 Tax=Enterococcus faecium TaxID=1352 RepID=UPI001F33B870|nr:hypothetical protein [Enterococcus faecium]MCF8636719.1 hypothetical protein [Enterococcus faecium]
MAVYIGQVSSKNGLGQVKNVTATDDISFAQSFGVSGNLGQVYSNQKIGMLKLEGDSRHVEVAIDPTEMSRVESLDYARNHVASIVDWGALANSLMESSRTEMLSQARAVSPVANIENLSNSARGEIAKLLVGVGNEEQARKAIEEDDSSNALIDTVKRTSVRVFYQQTSTVGGVEFTITAKGSTMVKVQESSKLINVRLVMDGHVAGSAGSAGAKYKESFVQIKNRVTSVSSSDNLDRSMKYDPKEDVNSIANNIYSLLNQTARRLVRQAVSQIEEEFSDLENFNPASIKARIWNELNLTTTEIPQSGLDEKFLRQYADGEITAQQFANIPENKMVQRLSKAIIKRLSKADISSFSERILDKLYPVLASNERNKSIKDIEKEVADVLVILQDEIENISDFQGMYELYSRPNVQWEKIIIDRTLLRYNGEDIKVDSKSEILELVKQKLYPLVLVEAELQYDNFRKRYRIEPYSSYDQPNTPKKVTEEYVEKTANDIVEEREGINISNVSDIVVDYVKEVLPLTISVHIGYQFDYEKAIIEARNELVRLLTTTNPYSSSDKEFWTEKASLIPRFREASQFAKLDMLQPFVEKYAPEWIELIKEGDNFNLKNDAEKLLYEIIENKADDVLAMKADMLYLPSKIVIKNKNIPSDIAKDEASQAVEDFLTLETELNENNLRDKAKEYVDDNYDLGYLEGQVSKRMDLDSIYEDVTNDLLEALKSNPTYSKGSPSFWLGKVRMVKSLQELGKYTYNEDYLDEFVVNYAPDWEEENK